jgi:hypothetical protein
LRNFCPVHTYLAKRLIQHPALTHARQNDLLDDRICKFLSFSFFLWIPFFLSLSFLCADLEQRPLPWPHDNLGFPLVPGVQLPRPEGGWRPLLLFITGIANVFGIRDVMRGRLGIDDVYG